MSGITVPMPEQPGANLPITVVFGSDWGVGTGAGLAGGVNSVVEKDEHGHPVVRGTALTGVVREQAATVARALDGAEAGSWHDFVTALFGTAEAPRLLSFRDAICASSEPAPVHEVVSLSIDETTGTAKSDFLRFFERAGACTLHGEVDLARADLHGRPIGWDDGQRGAAEFVLALAGLLVRGIGSNRSDGDGLCDVLIGERADATAARAWCREQLKKWSGPAPAAPTASGAPAAPRLTGPAVQGEGRDRGFLTVGLRLELAAPTVSYEVPLSNEVRSLDFLRGTALLPWVHRRLRAAFPGDQLVRDAVVAGDLLVSDATAVAGGIRGLPAPLVLSRPKIEGADPDGGCGSITVRNRLLDKKPGPEEPIGEAWVPVRSGYVFPGFAPDDAEEERVVGAFGAPSPVGRQSTAHDPATGAARSGQLFLVRALPAGLAMGASILMSARLREHLGERLKKAFPAGGVLTARMGARRLSGSYGRVRFRIGRFEQADPPQAAWDDDGATTLWFTSDVLVRSGRLGPGGSVPDLFAALHREGAAVELAEAAGALTAGVRHRRVDSWSAADQQPRATRTAVSAGSVLRVRPVGGADPDAVLAGLARLSITGLGELTAQGFGRFAVGHDLLGRRDFRLTRLGQEDFLAGRGLGAAEQGEQR